jgi:menaquinone-dependent protoporphyrinogen IX oxidase
MRNKIKIINDSLSNFIKVYEKSLFTTKEASKAFMLMAKKSKEINKNEIIYKKISNTKNKRI